MSGHNVQGHTHSIRGSVTVRRRDFRPPTAKMHGDSKCSPNYNPLSTFAKVGNSGVLIEHWGGYVGTEFCRTSGNILFPETKTISGQDLLSILSRHPRKSKSLLPRIPRKGEVVRGYRARGFRPSLYSLTTMSTPGNW